MTPTPSPSPASPPVGAGTYADGHELPVSEGAIARRWEQLAQADAAGCDTVAVSLRAMAALLLSLDAYAVAASPASRPTRGPDDDAWLSRIHEIEDQVRDPQGEVNPLEVVDRLSAMLRTETGAGPTGGPEGLSDAERELLDEGRSLYDLLTLGEASNFDLIRWTNWRQKNGARLVAIIDRLASSTGLPPGEGEAVKVVDGQIVVTEKLAPLAPADDTDGTDGD